MFWLLLAGYCGLTLSSDSVAKNHALQITQKPRYYGVKTGAAVLISCTNELTETFQWYWAAHYNARKELLPGQRKNITLSRNTLVMANLRTEDSGVYYCKVNGTMGPGTGVKVARNMTPSGALRRTRMKDGLMIFQGLLLAVCIAALLLRKRDLLEQSDSIYEEPETDHIYEGLAIETCGGGLYEELSVYAQVDGAEAPWDS